MTVVSFEQYTYDHRETTKSMSPFRPTVQQLLNLTILAKYLQSLPKNYRHFNMGTYAWAYGGMSWRDIVSGKEYLTECGSSACAIGHGPAAGIPIEYSDAYWPSYSKRVFGTDDSSTQEGYYMFGGLHTDNHREAAERILNIVEMHS